jgi:NAD(P)-dependent dehydrogenase (short-subunit alcohol dehydrogenase family)
MELKGKVALITGGAARLGGAISRGLADAGAHIVVNYNTSIGPAQEVVAHARRQGVDAIAVQADLSSPHATRQLAAAAQERFGGINILVHAASPFVPGSLRDLTLETWDMVLRILVDSPFLLTQALAPGMADRGQGAIVAILDRGAFDPWPSFLAHGVGKSALWALMRSLAVGLAPEIRVNAIVPGPILPPPGYSDEDKKRLARLTLLKRWGNVQDVVDAVLFLVRSDYITGEVLFVDGGERWAHRRS